MQEKTQQGGQAIRVIKHPLFRPFNSTQAEEYLGSRSRGDVVIRPSSRGPDHLAVTWKVGHGVYQHIDVLELDKENEFSVGRVLRVGGKYSYSDLDDLIVNHVKAMAKKVEEMMANEKYQDGSKAETGMFLLLLGDEVLSLTFSRSMARDVHQGQPPSLGLCLLHQPQTPWLLLSLFQGGRALTTSELARQGHPPGL